MTILPIPESAEFEISKKVIIRFKKDFGFYIVKEIGNLWYTCLKSCRINSLALGFKEQYGFSFKDMKLQAFSSYQEALEYIDIVDNFPYWEYNVYTHSKIFNSIVKNSQLKENLLKILK
jgi:hypothetical protein